MLKVTTKGQVTLRRSVLDHLGAGPGDRLVADLLPGGRLGADLFLSFDRDAVALARTQHLDAASP